MTIEQMGHLIQAIAPDLISLGNDAANGQWTHRNDRAEEYLDLAEDLERIAHELRSYLSPTFSAPNSALSKQARAKQKKTRPLK